MTLIASKEDTDSRRVSDILYLFYPKGEILKIITFMNMTTAGVEPAIS